MIEWIPLNPKTAPDEIDEDTFLINLKDRIISAQHDAMNHYFSYQAEDHEVVIPYRYITHYAHINWPYVPIPL